MKFYSQKKWSIFRLQDGILDTYNKSIFQLIITITKSFPTLARNHLAVLLDDFFAKGLTHELQTQEENLTREAEESFQDLFYELKI